MADSHMRLLRAVARYRERKLERFDAAQAGTDDGSAGRRHGIARTAARSRAQLAAAQARRRRPPEA
jgi:hypothetical protein